MRIIKMGCRTAFLFRIDHDLSAFEAFDVLSGFSTQHLKMRDLRKFKYF
jgi:hypothetical protein